MKLTILFFLSAFTIVMCDSEQEKRVYTDKDIEGYWATYPALHPSVLAEAIADSNDSIREPVLRFYNDINGFHDSTYLVKGDSVFIAEYEMGSYGIEKHYNLKYRIRSVARESLELWELETGQFITYYSLLVLPQRNSKLEKLELNPFCGEGFRWTRDSLRSTFSMRYARGCYDRLPRMIHVVSDSMQFARVDELYQRVNLANVMLELPREKPLHAMGLSINLVGKDRSDYLPVSSLSVDPCLLAIRSECIEMERWIYTNGE